MRHSGTFGPFATGICWCFAVSSEWQELMRMGACFAIGGVAFGCMLCFWFSTSWLVDGTNWFWMLGFFFIVEVGSDVSHNVLLLLGWGLWNGLLFVTGDPGGVSGYRGLALCSGPSKISSISVFPVSSFSVASSARVIVKCGVRVSGGLVAVMPCTGEEIFLATGAVFRDVGFCVDCAGDCTGVVVGVSSGSDGMIPFLSQTTSLMGSLRKVSTSCSMPFFFALFVDAFLVYWHIASAIPALSSTVGY